MVNLIGYGSHGKDIETVWKACTTEQLHLYDENPELGMLPTDITGSVIFGSNYPAQRRAMAQRFEHLPAADPLVDPSAIIGDDVWVGKGVVVAPFVLILRSAALDVHVHVNYGVTMTRCTVGAYSTIAPGATICGDVTIGDGTYVGANATVCDRVTIGFGCTIAAGAIIPPESVVPDNTTVIGVWKQ